ncbi:hypothetical protein [Paenarthrobacter sp. YIM B13468]|uniref:hypothetical protein n=1 Tax=Paenarthrobacter sp. YIM B13468 TaxID=3366295 RepID=UPI00366A7A8C
MSSGAVFRTPEDVAPELWMTPTELRRYSIESGHHTRLSRNRIMLHADDVANIIAWVRQRKKKPTDWAEESGVGRDPFA